MSVEQTLAIIKPDATARSIAGKIIARIEEEGFAIRGIRQVRLSKPEVECFYEVHRGKRFFSTLTDFMSSGPVMVLCLEREGAIAKWREVMGKTDPAQAAEGTIRKTYGIDVEKNSVHGSDSAENAKIEVGFFFSGLELV
jgi:nucleoside-diphosphate kinase